MADPVAAIRRLRRPRPEAAPVEPWAGGVVVEPAPEVVDPAAVGPVVVQGPLGAGTPLDGRSYAALVAAGLVVEAADGRRVVLGCGDGVVLMWSRGVVDPEGLPLPYLRNGAVVIPFAAADRWKWWRGGLELQEVQAHLEAAQQDSRGGR